MMKRIFFFITSISLPFLLSACFLAEKTGAPQGTTGTTDGGTTAPSVGTPTPPDNTPEAPEEISAKTINEENSVLPGKNYVSSILSEVFTSTTYNYTNLERDIRNNILKKTDLNGGACNTYSSYVGTDCAGDPLNSSLDFQRDASALRAMYKARACEILLNNDLVVKAGAEKLNMVQAGGVLKEVDEASMRNLWKLFMRSREPSDQEVSVLWQFNNAMKTRMATPVTTVQLTSRWRALFLFVCESPEWEVL